VQLGERKEDIFSPAILRLCFHLGSKAKLSACKWIKRAVINGSVLAALEAEFLILFYFPLRFADPVNAVCFKAGCSAFDVLV